MKSLRLLLYPFALIYGLVMAVRNTMYNRGWKKSCTTETPIICIGNLSTGGTGKSPMTIYIGRLLAGIGNAAVLSRGYGRVTRGFLPVTAQSTANEVGDEPLMISRACPEIRVYVGEDRCAAIEKIGSGNPGTEVILLDDAFQHRAVKAGLNILLTTWSDPFWKDHVLPAGNLREWANGAVRAQVVVVTKCPEMITTEEQQTIRKKIALYTPAPVFFAGIKYGKPYAVEPAFTWQEKYASVLCVSGIARPEAFHTQAARYAGHVEKMVFADHHRFTAADAGQITRVFEGLKDPKCVLVTEKDRPRLQADKACLNLKMLNEIPVFCQPVEFAILDGSNQFDQIIREYAGIHS